MTAAPTPEDLLPALSDGLADLVERAGASLVQIDAGRRPATGVIVGADRILTVDHLLDLDDHVRIRTADGRTLDAELAGRDPSSDLALLHVLGLNGTAIGVAADVPRPGSVALAIARGAAGGLVASFGLIGGLVGPVRSRLGPSLEQVIRVDAYSSPGFTGGVLADARGHALGITNAALVRGLRLAIPAAHAWKVVEAIAARGSIKRGYLGIGSQPVRIPEAQRGGRRAETGLLVVDVMRESPAARAGLLVGDIIVEFDGRATRDPAELLALLSPERVGATVGMMVLRAGAAQELKVTVGTRE